MATYYEELQDEIKRQKKELDSYYLEKRALYVSRRSWTQDSYREEENRINKNIEELNKNINKNKELLASYSLVNSYTDDIKALTTMYNDESDISLKDEISNEILRRREYINEKLDNLPSDLSVELRKYYLETAESIEDKKVLELENEKANLVEELDKAKANVSDSIKGIQDVFTEERFIIENNGPFNTEKELDDFYNEYMQKKIEKNELLQVAKRNQELLEKKVKALDKKITDRREIVGVAKRININPDDYENILNRIKQRDQVTKLFKTLGLEEMVEQRKQLLYPSQEELVKYRDLIKDKLIEEKINQRKRGMVKALPPHTEVKEVETVNNDKEHDKDSISFKDVQDIVDDEFDNKVKATSTKLNIPKNNIDDNTSPNVITREIKYKDLSPYGYKTIISNLVRGLEPNKRDGKRYRASNIDIKQEFKNELRSGNYLYNIVHVVPALVKIPVQLIRKLSAKITYRESAKKRMSIIKERLDDLSDQDLMILYKEYSNHAAAERYGTGLNILISERINKFVEDKVSEINFGLEDKYREIFNCVKELDAVEGLIHEDKTTEDRKEQLEKYKKDLVKGKADLVLSVRKDYEDAKTLLSSGLHGFNENMRATESKMSYIGKRFAKDHDLDVKLLEKEAMLEREERKAILAGDDLKALRRFVEAESLLCKNTKIENSIFGMRSTGKKYYSPLAEKLDYRNDPFIRDIFTTMAVVGASLTTINTLTHKNNISEVNAHNQEVMDSIHKSGEALSNKKSVYAEGMKAQSYQDSLNISNVLERKALDQSSEVHGGWSVGTQSYYDARSIAQGTYVDFYNSTKNAISDITTKYGAGNITQTEALNMLGEVTKNSQDTLSKVVTESLPHLANYARDHSQFDLAGITDIMNYIVANPNAITNMNNAMIDSVNIGENLQTLTLEQVNTLNSMPSNIANQLLTAASATALAMNINNKVNANNIKGKYGNNIINIVDNYIDSEKSNVPKRMI